MQERLLILSLTTVVNLSLGVLVWVKNPSHRVNQYFALFSGAVGTWTLSNGLVATWAESPWGIVWARAAFAAASLLALSFVLFVGVFPSPRPAPPAGPFRLCAGAGVAAFLASLTPLVAESTGAPHGVLQVHYGPLHPVFGVYFLGSLGYGLYLLYRKLQVLTGLEKLQVRYVFFGISLPVLGGTVTNLLVPLLFGSSRFSPYGPLFSILMVAVLAHAIIRHRLMNIRVVIRRSVAYGLAAGTVGGVSIGSYALLAGLGVLRRHDVPPWIALILALVIATIFQPLRGRAQALVDRYFFREPYDYQRTIREISRAMAGILDLRQLLRYAADAIGRTVRPEYVAVYAQDAAADGYRRLVVHQGIATDPSSLPDTIPARSSLAGHLAALGRPLIGGDPTASRRPGGDAALAELRRLGADIALPVLDEDRLAALFVVGPKLSGDPYFSEDLDLLTTLVGQAAVAIKNAQLYSQVVLAHEHIENILETIDSAVLAVSATGAITLFNSAAERLTGLDAAKVRGAPLRILPSQVAAPLELTLEDGQSRLQVETALEGPAGRVTPVICSTSPLFDRAGKTLGAVAVFSDLTRLKELESEKRRAERLASIGALASGIAHEIKNPLVAIRTFAELLPERFGDEEFRTEFAQVVGREIARIDDLVARLRGLASPRHSFAVLDIREPLAETLALLRGEFEQRQIAIRTDFDADVPPIRGDFDQLKQLFLNVLINALEAVAADGSVTVRIRTHLDRGTPRVVVDVIDTGPGIPEALLGRIFEPFVTTKSSGSGLGLSICRHIADEHNAALRASNNEGGRGATITIEFPTAGSLRSGLPGSVRHETPVFQTSSPEADTGG
jgi:PAS domain S-box-containing protein